MLAQLLEGLNQGVNLVSVTIPPYFQSVRFLTSAAELEHLPPDQGYEIAFAGRSNAGKSTALNVLTGQRNLARASKSPGRTQLINLFEVDEARRLVDLPGYGYAKVPLAMKKRWQATLARYLEQRQCLVGLVLLMDIRHPLKEYDEAMLRWADAANLPVHVVLTKADKLRNAATKQALQQVQGQLNTLAPGASLQSLSALDRSGLDKLIVVLERWLDLG